MTDYETRNNASLIHKEIILGDWPLLRTTAVSNEHIISLQRDTIRNNISRFLSIAKQTWTSMLNNTGFEWGLENNLVPCNPGLEKGWIGFTKLKII